jgi:hypothetical protein
MPDREYGAEVSINPNDILQENLTHASKCQYYGDRLADAILERDVLKSNLKVVEAELCDLLLRTWNEYYEAKPSEAIRNGWIIQQNKYKIALDEYQKSEHNVNLLKSADKAFDARGYSLGHVTEILVTGFSAAPKINKNVAQQNLRMEEIKKTKLQLKRPLKKP